MTRDRASGAALIVGAIAGLVTMALHPTGHDLMTAVGQSPWPARLNVLAHSIAIAASPLLFFGALGLTQRVAADHWLATVALVTYGFSLIAVMMAATASGLIAPHLIEGLATTSGMEREALDAAFHYNYQVNQAFAKVFVVMSSVAIGLWSVVILRTRALPGWIGVLGCIVAALVVVGLLTGAVRLNVHGFGMIMIAQSAWLIAAGARLLKPLPANGD